MIDGKLQEARLQHADSSAKIRVMTLNIVPLQMRYNLNKYIGAGLGTFVSFNINESVSPSRESLYDLISANGVTTQATVKESFERKTNNYNDFQNTFFADVQVGKVHVGPSIGFRYLYTLQGSNNRVITYLTWKF
ncbi:hypothetical protein D3C86_1662560 [compost metagenome]